MTDVVCITSESSLLRRTLKPWGSQTILESNTSLGDIENALIAERPKALILAGCRHILPASIYERQITVNLHPSVLPLGRGPVPHIWTLIEGQGIGVSLHVVDGGIDSGPIIDNCSVELDFDAHSLTSAYEQLQLHGALLLASNMGAILSGEFDAVEQSGPYSQHTAQHQEAIQDVVDENLKIPLSRLVPMLKDVAREAGCTLEPQR